jgi:hypothetical protein
VGPNVFVVEELVETVLVVEDPVKLVLGIDEPLEVVLLGVDKLPEVVMAEPTPMQTARTS